MCLLLTCLGFGLFITLYTQEWCRCNDFNCIPLVRQSECKASWVVFSVRQVLQKLDLDVNVMISLPSSCCDANSIRDFCPSQAYSSFPVLTRCSSFYSRIVFLTLKLHLLSQVQLVSETVLVGLSLTLFSVFSSHGQFYKKAPVWTLACNMVCFPLVENKFWVFFFKLYLEFVEVRIKS